MVAIAREFVSNIYPGNLVCIKLFDSYYGSNNLSDCQYIFATQYDMDIRTGTDNCHKDMSPLCTIIVALEGDSISDDDSSCLQIEANPGHGFTPIRLKTNKYVVFKELRHQIPSFKRSVNRCIMAVFF
jgi:hypothetical protein